MRNLTWTLLLVSAFFMVDGRSAGGAEPGWSPVIIATGPYRKQIEATPIEQRPYRPLHFYGNSVRRLHYRGTVLPVPRGWAPPQFFSRTLAWGRR